MTALDVPPEATSDVVRRPLWGEMSKVLPVSCFIIAKDEAKRIGRAISSVLDWVDEVVVVVDSSSSDGTQTVAHRLGARVVENPWPGYGAQKNLPKISAATIGFLIWTLTRRPRRR